MSGCGQALGRLAGNNRTGTNETNEMSLRLDHTYHEIHITRYTPRGYDIRGGHSRAAVYLFWPGMKGPRGAQDGRRLAGSPAGWIPDTGTRRGASCVVTGSAWFGGSREPSLPSRFWIVHNMDGHAGWITGEGTVILVKGMGTCDEL